MPTIAIGKQMNIHKLMMKARRQFFGRVSLMLYPVTGIIKQLA